MTIAHFLPWHSQIAQSWLGQHDRFAHAWLIHGQAGIGKVEFAHAAAACLLCESPRGGLACGQCSACAWVCAGNHPDLRRIRPDAVALEEGADATDDESDAESAASAPGTAKKAPSREIRIDQIRSLASWFSVATHRAGYRVAVLYPAESLNVMAANALLKMLEEPPESTVFLIVADAPDRLLPTLISRCRRLALPEPDHAAALAWLGAQGSDADAVQWLAAAGGAPLAAKRLMDSRAHACPAWLHDLAAPLAQGRFTDVGALAEQLEKTAASEWIDILQRFYVDLMLAAAGAPVRYFPVLESQTLAVARRAQTARMANGADWLTRQRRLARHPLNGKLFAHSALQRVVLSCQG